MLRRNELTTYTENREWSRTGKAWIKNPELSLNGTGTLI